RFSKTSGRTITLLEIGDRSVCQDLRRIVNADVVFDANSAVSRHVDAWLDGDDHVPPERIRVCRGEPRRLVNVEAEAGPGAVDEVLAVASVPDHGPGGRIARAGGSPGRGRGDAGPLGRAYGGHQLELALIRLVADDVGSGRMGEVPAVGGAEVDDDELTLA